MHRWLLRGFLAMTTLLLAYLGVVGLHSASSTSEDGQVLALVVGAIFLFLSAIALWWLWIELRRE